jgi:hypothetical protein
VARAAIRNQVINMVSRHPITVEGNIRVDMVNVEPLAELGFSQSAELASVSIAFASPCRLLAPVLALVSLDIAFVSPVAGTSAKSSATPYMALRRAILPISFSAAALKGFAAVKANLCNRANVTGVVLTGVDLTAKFQKALAAASLLNKRPLWEGLATDNANLKSLLRNSITSLRAKFAVSSWKLLATDRAMFHSYIIA